MWGALQIAKNLPEDKRVVCIFVDSLRNYITKFVSDDWLLENHLLQQKEYDEKYITNPKVRLFGESAKVSDVKMTPVTAVRSDMNVEECLNEFKNQNSDFVN
jgi:cystathionine beta-synthase